MWPTALANLGLDLKGKISAGAEPGRTVARLTDLGHGQALRALFREDTPDGPVPPGLAQAVMDVMKDWSPEWTSRPDVIVVVESATRPTLVRDLADGLSRVMQVPVVGTWAIRDASVPPRAGQSNSAQRVAAVRRRGRARRRHPRRGDRPARRRPGGDRLDAHRRRDRDPRGRRVRRAAPRPRRPGLTCQQLPASTPAWTRYLRT